MVVAAMWFWLHLVGNPIHELVLIQQGQSVLGSIVDTSEDVESGDEGGMHWTHAAIYTYRLPDGRKFTARTKDKSGRLKDQFRDLKQPYPIEVEYLPHNPAVSRIKGDGCQSVFEWLWRTVGLGGLLLAVLLSPAYLVLWHAIRDIKRARAGLPPMPYDPSA